MHFALTRPLIVFVCVVFVYVVLEHMALSLFVLATCSSVPASLFPCTTFV